MGTNRNYRLKRYRIRHTTSKIIICFIAVIGLYLPTSSGGNINDVIKLTYIASLCICLGLLILLNGVVSPYSILTSLLILLSITLATLVSSLPGFAPGGLIAFIVLALLFMVNLRYLTMSRLIKATYIGINLVNLVVGWAIVLNIEIVDQLLLSWYNDFYPMLLTNMVGWYNKPVLSFGSHSIAGLFMFLFMYLAIRSYFAYRNPMYLFLAFSYVSFLWFLQSVTSLILAVVAIIYCIVALRPASKRAVNYLFLIFPLVTLLLGVITLLKFSEILIALNTGFETILGVLTSPLNGFWGRFSEDGILKQNLAFIANSWYRPAGLRTEDGLFFGDSGPIEYMVRGSFLMLFSIYGGLYIFLSKNLRRQHTAIFLFLLILAAEIGFTHIKYFRLTSLLPFVVVYLNALPQLQTPSRSI